MHKRKTTDGGSFYSVIVGIQWILEGRWVCIDGRPVSNTWVSAWNLRTIDTRIRSGNMTKCLDAKTGLPYYG